MKFLYPKTRVQEIRIRIKPKDSCAQNMERVSRLDAVDEEQIKQDSARIKEIMDAISGNS